MKYGNYCYGGDSPAPQKKEVKKCGNQNKALTLHGTIKMIQGEGG